MKSKIINFLIYCGLLICLVSCSSIMSIETNSQANKNNVVQDDENRIVGDVKVNMECTLLSIQTSASENLSFPIKNKNSTLKISNYGKFSGSAIRNSFFGKYTKRGNNINFGNISATQVNCIECNDIENLIISKLSEVNNFVIDNKQLLLKRDSEVLMIYRIH